mgnify:CR=1 FL=1
MAMFVSEAMRVNPAGPVPACWYSAVSSNASFFDVQPYVIGMRALIAYFDQLWMK